MCLLFFLPLGSESWFSYFLKQRDSSIFFSHLSAADTLGATEDLFKKAPQAVQQNALGQQYMSRLHFKKKKNPLCTFQRAYRLEVSASRTSPAAAQD